ncbi:MAG: hypothetical protein HYU75_21875, partial [Betaproteobacteria bacterium]|nr:hypothetical protein [Betaproteobacteria bacterium]
MIDSRTAPYAALVLRVALGVDLRPPLLDIQNAHRLGSIRHIVLFQVLGI